MPVDSKITDDSGRIVRVTPLNELVVAPYDYSTSIFQSLALTNTAFNFAKPVAGTQFVITTIRAKASRSVSNTVDAILILYEAGAETSGTVDKTLHQELLIRGEQVTLTGLNLIVSKGVFLNAKTSDATIPMTVMGYYVKLGQAGTASGIDIGLGVS